MSEKDTTAGKDASAFVEIEMPAGGTAEPMNPDSLSFMPSTMNEESIGKSSAPPPSNQSYASSYFGNSGPAYSLGGAVSNSRVSGILRQRGFGWMMEVEQDDDDDNNVPLLEELDIQPAQIANRIRSVLLPLPNVSEKFDTNSPDFWGPLACVVAYALVSALGQFRVLPVVLFVWLAGSFVIFVVSRGLGAELTYSLCLGILGYSTLPLALIAIALPAFQPAIITSSETGTTIDEPFSFVAFFLKGVAMSWSTVSAVAAFASILSASGIASRKPLFAYPIFLFYGYLIALYTGA